MTELTILQPGDEIDGPSGPVGFLFECAPDGEAHRSNPGAVPIEDLIGDFDGTKRQAFELAAMLLAGEPLFRGVAQLRIFEEVVIRELQYAFHVLHLGRRLHELGVRTCRFRTNSRFSRGLSELSRATDLGIQIVAPDGSQRSPQSRSVANSWRRLAHSRFAGSRMREELAQALGRIDPFHRRRALTRKPAHKRGGLWFYSAAYTFTQIGLLYEPYFPERFEFLIENPATGGRALREAGRPFVDIYDFVSWSMAPSAREVREAADALTAHIDSVPLQGDDASARVLLLASPFFHTFLSRLLARGLFSTTLFERWIETTRPEAVIVGNPVFEGYALHGARRQGIPTILLQHGILGDFCQFIDPPVDHYVVRGEFWKEFLAPAARGRARVLNAQPTVSVAPAAETDRKAVVFITTPYVLQEFFQESDLDDILRALAVAAQETGRELVIRVHPLEQIDFYRTRLVEVLARLSISPLVSYSQGPGLDTVLRQAAVAVTYCSTVFLDCLRHHVPIISFDWHDFSYRKQLERWGVFHFSRDLAQLGVLVRGAVAGELAPFDRDTGPFLAALSDEVMRAELASLTRSLSPVH